MKYAYTYYRVKIETGEEITIYCFPNEKILIDGIHTSSKPASDTKLIIRSTDGFHSEISLEACKPKGSGIWALPNIKLEDNKNGRYFVSLESKTQVAPVTLYYRSRYEARPHPVTPTLLYKKNVTDSKLLHGVLQGIIVQSPVPEDIRVRLAVCGVDIYDWGYAEIMLYSRSHGDDVHMNTVPLYVNGMPENSRFTSTTPVTLVIGDVAGKSITVSPVTSAL